MLTILSSTWSILLATRATLEHEDNTSAHGLLQKDEPNCGKKLRSTPGKTTTARFAYQMPPPALVVADEEAQTAALVERALVRHGVHQHERVRPPDLRLELRLAPVLLIC